MLVGWQVNWDVAKLLTWYVTLVTLWRTHRISWNCYNCQVAGGSVVDAPCTALKVANTNFHDALFSRVLWLPKCRTLPHRICIICYRIEAPTSLKACRCDSFPTTTSANLHSLLVWHTNRRCKWKLFWPTFSVFADSFGTNFELVTQVTGTWSRDTRLRSRRLLNYQCRQRGA